MVRLNEHPKDTMNIILHRCGLLFLGTPHSGTTEADCKNFLLTCSEELFGVRREAIINNFESFNANSADNKERFNMIEPRLSVQCLCESRMMRAKGKKRLVRIKIKKSDQVPVSFTDTGWRSSPVILLDYLE